MRTINFYGIDLFNKKDGEKTAPFPLTEKDLRQRNDEKIDIYWTFNEFKEFGRRTKEDLIKIHSLYCEIDNISWEELKIKLTPKPKPSLIIKTGRGFHLYWYLKEPIDCTLDPIGKSEWFKEFIRNRLLPVYGADPNAVDSCRLLRAPFFKYWKDKGASDTWVDIVFDNEETKYSIKELERFFPSQKKIEPIYQNKIIYKDDDSFWKKANFLDCRYALTKLSGSSLIGGEVITFRQQSGLTRIVINGKDSNAWLDKNGKIGSMDKAGPSIVNWLTYYKHDMKKIADILKQTFEELK